MQKNNLRGQILPRGEMAYFIDYNQNPEYPGKPTASKPMLVFFFVLSFADKSL
jgi:hypothetical protein